MTLNWQYMTYKASKVGQTNIIFDLWSEFFLRLSSCMITSLSSAEVMLCVTDTHGHKHLDTQTAFDHSYTMSF